MSPTRIALGLIVLFSLAACSDPVPSRVSETAAGSGPSAGRPVAGAAAAGRAPVTPLPAAATRVFRDVTGNLEPDDRIVVIVLSAQPVVVPQ